MFSFNLWTGLPSPTSANVTHWFTLLTEAEQQAIRDAVLACGGNLSLAARQLGIGRSTLYRKLKTLG